LAQIVKTPAGYLLLYELLI